VLSALQAARPDYQFELIGIRTTGDQDQSVSLTQKEASPVGIFTKEIQDALLRNEIDFACHSAKDLPTKLSPGLKLAATLERDDISDAWIAKDAIALAGASANFVVGTGSPRRKAQLLRLNPALKVVPIRGNVDTRLRKMDEGEVDAIMLSTCGLERLGLKGRITESLCPETFLPAVGQGAIAIETREADTEACELAESINHAQSYAAVSAERSLLGKLEAGCQAPLGVHCLIEGERLTLKAAIYSQSGKQELRAEISGLVKEAVPLGEALADVLLDQGAADLMENPA